MSCTPCEEKKKKAAEEAALVADPQPVEVPTPIREGINCYCGLFRLIPTGLKVDDIFDLVPCPKCGTMFRGRYMEGGVEEVNGN